MAAHQAPPSLGFSRPEHWSGLPFPSQMHESGKWKVKGKSLSCVRLLATPWTAAHQAPPSMRFSRQEYWSGVPLLSPEYANILSLKLPQFSCLGRHCFKKDSQCFPCLLQIVNPSFSQSFVWMCPRGGFVCFLNINLLFIWGFPGGTLLLFSC